MRVVRPSIATICALAVLGFSAAPASAKVEAGVSDRLLLIVGGDGDDEIVVTCAVDGLVKVNGNDPGSGPTSCSKVVEVDAQTGAGNDVVDFSGVGETFGEALFPGFGTRTGVAAVLAAGNDRYIGSETAFNLFFGEDGKDRASGGSVRDLLSGGAGNDDLRGSDGRDTLLGNGDRDRLFGGAGLDTISGHAGNDLLRGEEGADALGGGGGRDRLFGGPGRDRLIGGVGRDALAGGPDKDREIEDPPKAKKP